MKLFVRYLLHPSLLILNMLIWHYTGKNDGSFLLSFLFTHIVLHLFESTHKAKKDWKQSWGRKGEIYLITLCDISLATIITSYYEQFFSENNLDLFDLNHLWPSEANVLLQIGLLFFTSEFLLYWIHRLMHQFAFMWRVSGHGFHHSFKDLHAINFMTAHPFELVFLILPSVFLGVVFGISYEVVIGASIFGLVNSSIVHSNIDMSPKVIGLILTTNRYHRAHHSIVFDESNTNFSCNIILYDRIFGTFLDKDIDQTGIGPKEPSLLEKILLPFDEPENVQTNPKDH